MGVRRLIHLLWLAAPALLLVASQPSEAFATCPGYPNPCISAIEHDGGTSFYAGQSIAYRLTSPGGSQGFGSGGGSGSTRDRVVIIDHWNSTSYTVYHDDASVTWGDTEITLKIPAATTATDYYPAEYYFQFYSSCAPSTTPHRSTTCGRCWERAPGTYRLFNRGGAKDASPELYHEQTLG